MSGWQAYHRLPVIHRDHLHADSPHHDEGILFLHLDRACRQFGVRKPGFRTGHTDHPQPKECASLPNTNGARGHNGIKHRHTMSLGLFKDVTPV